MIRQHRTSVRALRYILLPLERTKSTGNHLRDALYPQPAPPEVSRQSFGSPIPASTLTSTHSSPPQSGCGTHSPLMSSLRSPSPPSSPWLRDGWGWPSKPPPPPVFILVLNSLSFWPVGLYPPIFKPDRRMRTQWIDPQTGVPTWRGEEKKKKTCSRSTSSPCKC